MKLSILAAAAMLCVTSVAQASVVPSGNLISNGSFEDINGTALNGRSWRVFQNDPNNSVVDWAVKEGAGVEIQKNSVGSVLDTLWGNHYVELDSHNANGGNPDTSVSTNSAIGQSVMLGAGTYRLSFHYSPRTNSVADNGVAFSMTEAGAATAKVSGVANGPSGAFPHGVWTEVSHVFSVTMAEAGSFELLFKAVGPENTLGGLIDNVQLNAVPLPAGALLMLTALGGLGFARRRS